MKTENHFECGGFDELPSALNYLISKVENLAKTLEDGVGQTQNQEKSPEWLDIGELVKYLPERPSKATVYGWVSKKKIPYHKRERRIYFLKADVDRWLRSGRVKTDEELEREVGEWERIGKG